MNNKKIFSFSFFIPLFLALTLLTFKDLSAELDYRLSIEGVQDQKLHDDLRAVARLVSLKDRPVQSAAALRRRADNDRNRFIKLLHSEAFYDAQVRFDIDVFDDLAEVKFHIDPGPQYPLAEVSIQSANEPASELFAYDSILPCEIGLTLGQPAKAEEILQGEEELLLQMACKGYPLASISKRDVVINQETQSVSVTFFVNSGPLTYFGCAEILGDRCVRESFIRRRLKWQTGEIYCPTLVEKSIAELENTGLFSSITITHSQEVTEDNYLPMTIRIKEAKQRSIALGASYTFQRGIGALFEWDHRNITGRGDKFQFRTNIWRKTQEVSGTYTLPDFLERRQNLILLAEAEREDLRSYDAASITLGALLEKPLNDCTKFTYGVRLERLHNSDSDNDGNYTLVKFPFHLRWTNAKDIFDPTYGNSFSFKFTPTFQIDDPGFTYYKSLMTTAAYVPIDRCCKAVLAGRIQLGSILGSSRKQIPPSERFYAGSESTLRGYAYLTVSPIEREVKIKDDGEIDIDYKPKGGRSLFVTSLELRMRMSEKYGYVLFYDVGNVYEESYPNIFNKVLQSVGAGFRYFTPVGPIRLDIAFPLNKRRHFDHDYQLYISIGQTF